jgi:hypothetical protein
MQPTKELTRKQPPPKVCAYCGTDCDLWSPTAKTGRPTLCTCCCRWFCEFCLHEHQRSPEYRNPFARQFMQTPDRKQG